MKAINTEFLGEIPYRWQINKVKHVARLKYGDTLCNRGEGEIPTFGSNGEFDCTYEANTSNPVIVIGRKGSFGKVNWSDNRVFATDTTFYVDGVKKGFSIRWLYWILRWTPFDHLGQDIAVPGLPRELVHNTFIPVPPHAEQQKIAQFLDHETAKIDRLIAKQEKLLELLDERKKTSLKHYLKNGTRENVEKMDVGIDWLGKVPAHWQNIKMKRLGKFKAGSGFPDSEQGHMDRDIPYAKVADLTECDTFWDLHKADNTVSRETAKQLGAYIFPENSVVFAKIGEALKLNRACKISREFCIDNNMMGFVPKKCDADWAKFWLAAGDLAEFANPGAVPSINDGQMRKVEAAVPPLDEQREIARYILEEMNLFRIQKTNVRKAIELLNERKQALISAAVTGQIDVRDWAPPAAQAENNATEPEAGDG